MTRVLPAAVRGTSDSARRSRRRGAIALATFAALWSTAVLVYFRLDEKRVEEAHGHSERRILEIGASVTQAFAVPLSVVRSLVAFLEALPDLDAARFESYARHAARDNPTIVAMRYRTLVGDEMRAAFERERALAIRAQHRDQSSAPAPHHRLYLPVTLAGDWENRSVLGTDILSSSEDNLALKALDSGEAVGAVRTLSARAAAVSMCLLQSVRVERNVYAPEGARAGGVAEICLAIGPVIEAALAGLDARGLSLSVYDLSAAAGQHLIFGSGSSAPVRAEGARPRATREIPEQSLHTRDLRIADRWWRIALDAYVQEPSIAHPYHVLLVGFLVALLAVVLILSLGKLRSMRAHLEAAEKLGQYVIEDKIGEGSMGVVYRARHSLLRRPTAIKVMPVLARTERALERFAHEVRITASLSHPNTIAVYDFGHTDDGGFYYAMEYLNGIDLQTLVENFGPQPEARVIHILVQICGALAEAHAQGLIHRDVKPANLMLGVQGGIFDFVKVLDFGLVKDLRDPSELERCDFVGTPLYAAPETVDAPERVDGRADLYSLAAVAFFLLAGREVFRGPRVIDVLEQHATAEAPRLADVGVETVSPLAALIEICLAKLPEQRPQSAEALRESLIVCMQATRWSERDARMWWTANGRKDPRQWVRRGPGLPSEDIALGATLIQPLVR